MPSPVARRTIAAMHLDLASVLLTVAGIAAASGLAVLAGTLSARIFFDASGDRDES